MTIRSRYETALSNEGFTITRNPLTPHERRIIASALPVAETEQDYPDDSRAWEAWAFVLVLMFVFGLCLGVCLDRALS